MGVCRVGPRPSSMYPELQGQDLILRLSQTLLLMHVRTTFAIRCKRIFERKPNPKACPDTLNLTLATLSKDSAGIDTCSNLVKLIGLALPLRTPYFRETAVRGKGSHFEAQDDKAGTFRFREIVPPLLPFCKQMPRRVGPPFLGLLKRQEHVVLSAERARRGVGVVPAVFPWVI